MKIKVFLTILLVAWVAQAREPRFYQKGTLAEMNSVDCGYEEKGAKGVTGVLLGTDAEHKKTREMLCQEYVLRSDRIVYRIRPKDEKHPALLLIGEEGEFRIHKDRMYLRVPEGDNKERQYVVVSMKPRTDVKAAQSADASKATPKSAD